MRLERDQLCHARADAIAFGASYFGPDTDAYDIADVAADGGADGGAYANADNAAFCCADADTDDAAFGCADERADDATLALADAEADAAANRIADGAADIAAHAAAELWRVHLRFARQHGVGLARQRDRVHLQRANARGRATVGHLRQLLLLGNGANWVHDRQPAKFAIRERQLLHLKPASLTARRAFPRDHTTHSLSLYPTRRGSAITTISMPNLENVTGDFQLSQASRA